MYLEILKKNNFLDLIEKIILFVIIYLMCTREYNPHDEQFIILLGLVVLLKQIYKKMYYKIEKINFILIIGWGVFIIINYLKSKNIEITNPDIFGIAYPDKLFKYLIIEGILFNFILNQIELNRDIKYKIIFCINIFSIYLITKGLKFSLENGFFVRGPIWRNPNHYAMIMGVFIIISFISFIYEQNLKLKSLYFILNIFQLFFMFSVGQSRNVFGVVLILYFILLVFYFLPRITFKNLIFYIFIVTISIFMIFLFCNNYSDFRIFNVSFNDILKDPRIFAWKEIFSKETLSLFLGKGFGYYCLNPYHLNKFNIDLIHLHNDFLEILITQGLVSVFFYFGIIFYNLFKLIKIYLEKREIDILITISLLIYVLLIGVFECTIYQKRVMQFLFFFLSISSYKYIKIIK